MVVRQEEEENSVCQLEIFTKEAFEELRVIDNNGSAGGEEMVLRDVEGSDTLDGIRLGSTKTNKTR